MQSSIETELAAKILNNSINLYRLTAGERKKVIVILRKMQKELTAKLASSGEFTRSRAQFFIKESETIISDYYAGINPLTIVTLL